MDNWYVAFIRNGREEFTIDNIKKHNDREIIKNIFPFVPKREKFIEKKGEELKKVTSILYPGYVFFETAMDTCDFLFYIKSLHYMFPDIIRALKYGDSDEMAVRREEQYDLLELMDPERCIKASGGFMENGDVHIIDGPLRGYEAKIKKIHWSKRVATLKINIHSGRESTTEVALRYLKQADFMTE